MVASANESVTLYAVWKDKTTHTVTFNAGTNGSFANTSDPLINQTVIKGLSVTGVPAVTASGRYRFDGWKLDGDSSGKVYTNDEVKAMVINGNMTFTASYTYVGGSSGGGGSVSSYIIKATAGAKRFLSVPMVQFRYPEVQIRPSRLRLMPDMKSWMSAWMVRALAQYEHMSSRM